MVFDGLLKVKNDEIISQNQKLLARLEKIENISLKLQNIAEMNNITITNKSIDLLYKMSKGDMRKLLNIFQLVI